MMREGREVLDSTHGRSSRREMMVHNEGIEEKERYRTRHMAAEERGFGAVTMRGYEDGQLPNYPRSNDEGYRVRDNDTASKFQWTNLLNESGNSAVDGRERDREGGWCCRDSEYARYGRKYDGLVEKSMPAKSEMVSNSFGCGYNVGSGEYCGGSRSMSSRSVEDPNYRGHSRNVTDLPAEDARYYRHARSMTDLPNDVYNGYTRKATGRSVEDDEHSRHSRTVTGLSVEDDEHRRHSRTVTGLSVEDDEHRRHSRTVTGLSVEDDEHRRHSRTVTGLSVEYDEHRRHSRTVTGLSVEDDEHRRHSRTVTGLSAEGAERHRQSADFPIEDAYYQQGTRNVAVSLVEDRRRCLAREHPRHMDREISARSYDERDLLRFRNEDSSHSLTPRSHSNGQRTPNHGTPYSNLEGPHSDVFHHRADRRGTGGSISPSDCYGSRGIVYSKASTDASPVSCKGINFSREEYDPNRGMLVDCTHQESQRSGKIYRRPMSPDIYANYEYVQDYHDHDYPFGNDTSDPALPRHDYIGNYRDYDHTLEEEPIVHMADRSRIHHDHKIEYGGPNLQSMNRYLKYRTEAGDDDTMLLEEDCPYEMGSHGMPYEDDTRTYPILLEGALVVDEVPQPSGDIDMYDQSKRIPKRKRGSIGKTRLSKHKNSFLGGRGALSYDSRYSTTVPESESVYPNRYTDAVPEDESVYQSRSSGRHLQSKANARMSKTDPRLPFGGLSKELQSRLSKPYESGNTSVKKRLNPRFVPRQYGPKASQHFGGKVNSSVRSSPNFKHTTSAPLPYGQGQRTSVKKRLKAAPDMDVCPPHSQVSYLDLNSEPQDNLDSKYSGAANEADVLKEADPDYSILKVKPTEKDPPDDSEELMRLVDHWFMKCMLYLNANPGRLKKFKEQGKAGSLKCGICSSSKEFIQTKDLATHAFTSPKVGLRAPHLGFHRALCVLMGWDPTITSNGRWVCNSLPDVEAQALKEDLILWPPVVIVHNSSAGDFTNETVKLSFGQLENTLKEMGLSEGKTTICCGKPGSQNIRLVRFNGTLSGLQEAERLHNFFSEKKHGRAGLQEVGDGVRWSEGSTQEAENKLEDTLYGYLGIVEDFDKLNYEMRRHIVAKSKKETLARANTAT